MQNERNNEITEHNKPHNSLDFPWNPLVQSRLLGSYKQLQHNNLEQCFAYITNWQQRKP